MSIMRRRHGNLFPGKERRGSRFSCEHCGPRGKFMFGQDNSASAQLLTVGVRRAEADRFGEEMPVYRRRPKDRVPTKAPGPEAGQPRSRDNIGEGVHIETLLELARMRSSALLVLVADRLRPQRDQLRPRRRADGAGLQLALRARSRYGAMAISRTRFPAMSSSACCSPCGRANSQGGPEGFSPSRHFPRPAGRRSDDSCAPLRRAPRHRRR